MKDSQIIQQVSQRLNIPNETGSKLFSALVSGIREICLEGDSIAIPGFGTISPNKYDETIVSDATTGKKMMLPPSILIEFNPSIVLRKKLAK